MIMTSRILSICALVYGASATLVSPAVPASAPAQTVYLIPQGGATTSNQYIEQDGSLASLPISSTPQVLPSNFTIINLNAPAGTVGWFSLKNAAGPCSVKGNKLGGQFVCGSYSTTGLPFNELIPFQGYTLPNSTTVYLSLVDGSQTWYDIQPSTSASPPPATVYNGASNVNAPGIISVPFNIAVIPV